MFVTRIHNSSRMRVIATRRARGRYLARRYRHTRVKIEMADRQKTDTAA